MLCHIVSNIYIYLKYSNLNIYIYVFICLPHQSKTSLHNTTEGVSEKGYITDFKGIHLH